MPDTQLRLHLRSRAPTVQTVPRRVPARETALLLCDVWDRHWCRSAAARCDALARRMAPIVEACRDRGVFILHAPSDCMAFYADTPARRRMTDAPPLADAPAPLTGPNPLLPIDDSDGGCDDLPPCPPSVVWTRQHAAIRVADADGVAERGDEVYRLLRARGIATLLVMGVHANMCILHRSFGVRQMTRWGIGCVLVRDLTDALYNPRRPPFVSHDEGTRLVVEHIEAHWCPSILSADLPGAPLPGD